MRIAFTIEGGVGVGSGRCRGGSGPGHMGTGGPQPPPGLRQVAPRGWPAGGGGEGQAHRGVANAPGWAVPPMPSATQPPAWEVIVIVTL